ncbi:hypothetical protein [Metabacillus sp. FJAT-52054]|uniref:Uncharacterized protein n=1 Tax=Metabacillus sediminis TaxID=3117746 RepID=A0ABZ2NG86_9BACI
MEKISTYSAEEILKVCHLLKLHNLFKSYAEENEISAQKLKQIKKETDSSYFGERYRELRDYLEQINTYTYRMKMEQPNFSQRLFFNSFRNKKWLCETVQHGYYSYSFKQTNVNIIKELSNFFKLDESSEINDLKVNVKVSTAYYNGIHLMPEQEYLDMMRDPHLSETNQLFLKDFLRNERQINSVALSKTTDMQHNLYGTAFIPSGNTLWLIETDKSDVLFLSSSVTGYLNMVQSDIKSLLTSAGDQKNEAKFGALPFLRNSSLVLLGIIILFLVNVQMWQDYRWFMMVLFWAQFQILIVLLAFIIKIKPSPKH